MPKLHELTAAYKQLEILIDDPEMDAQQLTKYIEECEGALKEKAINITMLLQNLESTAESIKVAEGRMAARRKAIENRMAAIKDYILVNMKNSGVMKIECEYFVLAVQNSPPKVVIDDENAIPIAYLRQPEPPPPSPDKKAMLEDMKLGVVIDGARIEQSVHLRIR